MKALWDAIRRWVAPRFAPRSALDFGCGVGRLLVPLARRCPSVVGVDVADSMLAQARARCDAVGVTNVRLLKSDDRLSRVDYKLAVARYLPFVPVINRDAFWVHRKNVHGWQPDQWNLYPYYNDVWLG